MASRENQGLQIAVMIFFLLVVLLAVMTYVFFKSATDAKENLAKTRQDLTTKNSEWESAVDESRRLKALIGFSDDVMLGSVEEAGTIEAEFKTDMDTYGVGFEGDNRDYRVLLAHLFDANKKIAAAEAASKQREKELTDKLAVVEGTKHKQIEQVQQGADQAAKDLGDERGKFNTDRSRFKESTDSVAKQLDSKRNEMDDVVAKLNADVKRLAGQVQKLTGINGQLRDRLNQNEQSTIETTPDGRITWVNQRSRVVWISLGEADGLKRQTTFSVYPGEQNQIIAENKKGSIEVARIIDRHLAEARILDDDLSAPILPGDKISSPVWERGRHDGYALAGFMDIDGDGRSDRDKVRDLITFNGGDIHCEVSDEGKITGKLLPTTRFLILGDAPDAKTSQDLIDAYSRLTGEAGSLGITKVPVSKFIDEVGYRPDQRTVPLGRGAKPEDFKPEPHPGGAGRSTGGAGEGFKKRTRPLSTF